MHFYMHFSPVHKVKTLRESRKTGKGSEKTGKDSASTPFRMDSGDKRRPVLVSLLRHSNDHNVLSWVLATLFYITQWTRESVKWSNRSSLSLIPVSALATSLLSLSWSRYNLDCLSAFPFAKTCVLSLRKGKEKVVFWACHSTGQPV